jgi:hypothetical protein
MNNIYVETIDEFVDDYQINPNVKKLEIIMDEDVWRALDARSQFTWMTDIKADIEHKCKKNKYLDIFFLHWSGIGVGVMCCLIIVNTFGANLFFPGFQHSMLFYSLSLMFLLTSVLHTFLVKV